jgi:acetyl esterase/lipase
MTTRLKVVLTCAWLAGLFNGSLPAAPSPKVIALWPGAAPGDQGDIGEEHDTTKPTDGQVAGKPVVRLGNVSKPALTLYRPPPDKDTGVAVMVCPGGGYSILAMDLEGTEVCEWLNSLGITGALLKYRVPKRPGLEKHVPALQDAQRALGLLRQQSKAYGIDPKRIGVMGFSAGGHLAAALGNIYDHRTYPAVDEADAVSCRPDYTLLVYPAYLTVKEENDKIAPELNITSNTPPAFIAMAEDDPVRVETALFYAAALRKSKVPFELHIFPVGGHGYGLRPTRDLVTTWPQRAAEWMRSQGWLSPNSKEPQSR